MQALQYGSQHTQAFLPTPLCSCRWAPPAVMLLQLLLLLLLARQVLV
jgi:hypothetical protein